MDNKKIFESNLQYRQFLTDNGTNIMKFNKELANNSCTNIFTITSENLPIHRGPYLDFNSLENMTVVDKYHFNETKIDYLNKLLHKLFMSAPNLYKVD